MTKQNEPVAVHPVAAMFPMMTDEELEDLAADIAANGLRDPIMYDAKGTLIDGRNRLAACQRLGWIDFPRETLPEGEDAVAYILSKNVTRRHLSKGQAAISVARARQIQNQSEDDTQDVPKRDNIRVAAQQAGVSKTRVGLAVIVLDYAPELADAVLAGALSLDSAYETAKARKQAKEERDEAEVNAQHLQPKRYKLARRKIPRCLHRAWSIARVPMHLDGDVRPSGPCSQSRASGGTYLPAFAVRVTTILSIRSEFQVGDTMRRRATWDTASCCDITQARAYTLLPDPTPARQKQMWCAAQFDKASWAVLRTPLVTRSSLFSQRMSLKRGRAQGNIGAQTSLLCFIAPSARNRSCPRSEESTLRQWTTVRFVTPCLAQRRARDYERRVQTSETLIEEAAVRLMIRRQAKPVTLRATSRPDSAPRLFSR